MWDRREPTVFGRQVVNAPVVAVLTLATACLFLGSNARADGWIVGTTGSIYASVNAGETWSPQISDSSNDINDVFFLDDELGYAVGSGGLVLKTTNGGATWNDSYPTGAALNGVYFATSQTGWAVGSNGTILRTINGGSDWTTQNPVVATLSSVFFVSSTTGWVVGTGGIVLKTTNGGGSWNPSYPTGAALRDVFFLNSSLGWVVGTTGNILKTVNGGSSWATSTPVSTTLNAVHFVSTEVGWVVGGGGTILSTANAGSDWSSDNPVSAELYDVDFYDAELGWAVGASGTILRTTNGGDSWSSTYPSSATFKSVQFRSVPVPIAVTVGTLPEGRLFTVDGVEYTSTQVFDWFADEPHTIGTSSPQSGGSGTRFVWQNWSDGGAITHTISPSSSTSFTAAFTTQHYLTMSNSTGGTVSPSSGWRNAGSSVTINASSASGYLFSDWSGSGSGSYTGEANPATATMLGPITQSAAFVEVVSTSDPPQTGWQDRLAAVSPNPFNPRTEIAFELAKVARVTVAVYTVGGRKIRTILGSVELAEGPNATVWNGQDELGQLVASGVYFIHVSAGNWSAQQKVTLLK